MNVSCLSIGKTKEVEYVKFIQHYEKKLKHYLTFSYVEFPSLKNANKLNQAQLKEEEGKFFLSKITSKAFVILLDEKGGNLSSPEFAKYINKRTAAGGQEIVFVIGGAYGFSQEMYDRSNDTISLSRMTFTHQMVRVIFLEQLYRGCSILRGEKYHH